MFFSILKYKKNVDFETFQRNNIMLKNDPVILWIGCTQSQIDEMIVQCWKTWNLVEIHTASASKKISLLPSVITCQESTNTSGFNSSLHWHNFIEQIANKLDIIQVPRFEEEGGWKCKQFSIDLFFCALDTWSSEIIFIVTLIFSLKRWSKHLKCSTFSESLFCC